MTLSLVLSQKSRLAVFFSLFFRIKKLLSERASVQKRACKSRVRYDIYKPKPPIVSAVLVYRSLFRLLKTVLLVELINTAAGIDELLLAGVEGMALGADLNGDVLAGGAGLDQSAAGASDDCGLIVGMNSGFHIVFSSS